MKQFDKKDISVFVTNNEKPSMQALQSEAKKQKLTLGFETIHSLQDAKEILPKLGQVVFWRNSKLKDRLPTTTFLTSVKASGRTIVNVALVNSPFVSQKLYQNFLAATHGISTIPTFHFFEKKEVFQALKDGKLVYPFIVKKSVGACGEQVYLVNKKNDLSTLPLEPLQEYIFQPFIKNTGDYRVFVVGGKPLGVLKRIAKDGHYRNNISQGGSGENLEDKELREKVINMSLKASSLFGLQICGVDVLEESETGRLFFMEINTVPSWDGDEGFETITKTNVTKEIVSYCQALLLRQKKSVSNLVRSYYDKNLETLETKKFHYLSRMYSWYGGKAYRSELNLFQADYIGKNEDEREKILRQAFHSAKSASRDRWSYTLRKDFIKKYPLLGSYNAILFKVLFAETLYKIDLRPAVKRLGLDKDIIVLFQKLQKDTKAIQNLSTRALNFFYLVEFYFGSSALRVEPKKLLDCAEKLTPKNLIEKKNLLYFYTHCIIGASRFYSKPIVKNRSLYLSMLKNAENIIATSYNDCSLDTKLEFLVCARLCRYQSTILEKRIYDECNTSLSTTGNYIINKHNRDINPLHDNFLAAEHTNVLYIMSQTDPRCNKRV